MRDANIDGIRDSSRRESGVQAKRKGPGKPGRASLHTETLSARPRAKFQELLVWL